MDDTNTPQPDLSSEATEQADIPTSELPRSTERTDGLPPTEPRPAVQFHGRTTSFKPKRGGRVLFVAALVVLALVAVGAVILITGAKRPHQPASVAVTIVAPGYDEERDSPIPLKINGADLDDGLVDEVRYVTPSNSTLTLVPGTYTLSVPASPLLSNGTLYVVDTISSRLDVAEAHEQQGGATISFGVASRDQMTDAALEAARSYASKAGLQPDAVKALADAVVAHRASLYPATYSYRMAQVGSEDDTIGDGGDAALGGSVSKGRFVYPVVSSSKPNDIVDSLNAEMKQEAEKAASTYTETPLFLDTSIDAFALVPSYFAGGVMATRCQQQISSSFSSEVRVSSRTIDLEDGTELEPWEVVGLSKSQLNSCAIAAISAYVGATRDRGTSPVSPASPATPASPSSPSETSSAPNWFTQIFTLARTPEEVAREVVGSSRVVYWLSEDGVVAWLGQGALELGSAPVEVLACDFAGNGVSNAQAYEWHPVANDQMTGRDPLTGA